MKTSFNLKAALKAIGNLLTIYVPGLPLWSGLVIAFAARNSAASLAGLGMRHSQSGCRSFSNGTLRAILAGRSGWPCAEYSRQDAS